MSAFGLQCVLLNEQSPVTQRQHIIAIIVIQNEHTGSLISMYLL
jgi:hypothetical protein